MKHSKTLAIASLLIVASAIASPARADWILTTSDFDSRPVALKDLGDAAVTVTPPDGGAGQTIKFDKLLQLSQTGVAADAEAGAWVLQLSDGDRIVGGPAGAEGQSVVWVSKTLGRLVVPLTGVRSIHHPGTEPGPPNASEDVVRLTNGDQAAGVFQFIDGQTVKLADGTSIPLASVVAIDLAVVGEPKPPKTDGPTFRVGLSDGSAVTATHLGTEGDLLSFTPAAGQPARVPLSSVASIEQLNGPVVWLSSLTPTEAKRTPYLETDATSGPPYLADRSITGGPILAAGKPYARGLGVHSQSTLTFAVPKGATKFRTQYALMDGLPYADVSVRVLVDGKPVHEAEGVRSGELSKAVEVPVEGAKQVTLEVGYGENYDVQDRLNWVQPAFVK